ncbi:alpha/beta hydrolase family protein [Gaoshiqia sp. Z1-71]|uniref:alpha/beta hydrolase family protein n=1 Tax=Gaoshiqia hydrogeniformans TaxID=3290090 RepID=UPI003BF7F4FC
MRRLPLLLLLMCSLCLHAQISEKKTLTTSDFASWNTIDGVSISNNGRYVGYELNPQRGDGKLLIYHSGTHQTDSIPRAFGAIFSPEENFVVFKIKAPLDSARKAELRKVKKEDMHQDSLGIFFPETKKTYKYPKLKSFAVPKENAEWITFLTGEEFVTKDSVLQASETPGKDKTPKNNGDKVKNMILFHAKSADTIRVTGVSEFYIPKEGQCIGFIRETGDSVKTASVHLFDPLSREIRTVFQAQGEAKKLVTDDRGTRFAFLFSPDTTEIKTFVLKTGSCKSGLFDFQVDKSTQGIPIGWAPCEHGNLFFSEDGSRLFLGTAPLPVQDPKDTLTAEERVQVDVWSWHDLELQSQQKVNVEKEKKRSYLAVVFPDDQKFIQLADPSVRDITTTGKGNGQYALGKNELPYKRALSWTGNSSGDYYAVDTETGVKHIMVQNMDRVWISPHGKNVVWYNPADSSYYARSTNPESQSVNRLTKSIPLAFYDELSDTPDDPQPYGLAGWGKDDRFVYIYDRYDIWKVDLGMTTIPVNVTRGFGRKMNLRFRYLKLDPEENFIDPEKTTIAASFDENTKASGFFTVDFKKFQEPRLLLDGSYKFGIPQKAKNQEKIVYTRESCVEFPDLWLNNLRFEKPIKISDANPQQKEYNWVDVMLVKWTSFSGEKMEGLLYIPENFSSRNTYPMIVYFYERNSDHKFAHSIPSPSRSVVNKTFYASNGYLIFVPDIVYKNGYPGQSAYEAIVSGTQYLINNYPFIDGKKIGLQGQSWGGYQTAYLITQTELYAAAMAGAPVSNMISAYGGIRWESGMSRMYQYERKQSRIGGTFWDKPMQYIENSPLFYAPKVKTPLLIMHNDNDGAVPWYQGIELFTALRRLDKPVWMLTYNNEQHNLKKESWGNRMDLDIRMKGFFDHYLKDKPMPLWMKNGVPAKDKGKETGY